jgi:hypothetical protein
LLLGHLGRAGSGGVISPLYHRVVVIYRLPAYPVLVGSVTMLVGLPRELAQGLDVVRLLEDPATMQSLYGPGVERVLR